MRMKSLTKFHRKIYNGVLQPAILLKITGFLLILEAAVLMCLKNYFFRKILGNNMTHQHKHTIFHDSVFQ